MGRAPSLQLQETQYVSQYINFILFYFNIHIINKKYIEYKVSH